MTAAVSKVTKTGFNIILNRAYLSTPTKEPVTKFKVSTTDAEFSEGLTDLTNKVTIDADDEKPLESGYPSVDENEYSVTFRAKLTTTEANGNLIKQIGYYNEDDELEGGSNSSGYSKSSGDILVFISKRFLRNKVGN